MTPCTALGSPLKAYLLRRLLGLVHALSDPGWRDVPQRRPDALSIPTCSEGPDVEPQIPPRVRGCAPLALSAGLTVPVVAQATKNSCATAEPQGGNGRALTSPKQQFGHNIGDDYWLPDYTQFTAYIQKLAKESPRMRLVDIGKTAQGRTQLAAIITAPENFAMLSRYKDISERLAHAQGLTGSWQAHALAKEGKAVVSGSTADCTASVKSSAPAQLKWRRPGSLLSRKTDEETG